MGTLTSKQRDNLDSSQFALSGGRYPINDVGHARNALARAAQEEKAGNLSAKDEATVERRANAFLNAHEGKNRHADSVKSANN